MDTFGTRLRAARLAAKMTQQQAAHGIMSTSQLSLLERNQRRPSVEALAALAERLEVASFELSGGLQVVGRARPECRLDQAERFLCQRYFAAAERLATKVISSGTYAERRMRALCIRAEAREGLQRPQFALCDLTAALEIAQHHRNRSAAVRIALRCARLRQLLTSDDVA